MLIHPERDPKVFWHAPTGRRVMFLYGEQKTESGLFLKTAGGDVTINRLKLVYLKPA